MYAHSTRHRIRESNTIIIIIIIVVVRIHMSWRLYIYTRTVHKILILCIAVPDQRPTCISIRYASVFAHIPNTRNPIDYFRQSIFYARRARDPRAGTLPRILNPERLGPYSISPSLFFTFVYSYNI